MSTRIVSRWLCVAAAGLLLLSSGWILHSVWQNRNLQSSHEKPVAAVGNQLIYEKDYAPSLVAEIQKIRTDEYDVKRRALEGLINKRLVQAEAAKRGIKEDELLRREVDSKATEPEESAVEQVWVAQMFQGGQPTESKDQIREKLKQQQILPIRQEFFHRLREQAGVKIYLLPPAMDVAYDPSRVRGNPDAKITLVEFSDFHCPFCRQAYSTVKNLLRKYDGKIKLAYRDLPLMEVDTELSAAEASRCAGDQGQFWPYHDLLFESQGDYGPSDFLTFADSLHLNVQQFRECLSSRKHKEQVKQDFQEALRLGATGTPYFFVNGISLSGARPQAEFEIMIEEQLTSLSN
jgi:protein-disulfide isomerase